MSDNDPFPRTGLVKQYEPFIRKTVRWYCRKFPGIDRRDMLHEAVFLAIQAEMAFEPARGFDFSTFLRWHLRGLSRFALREYKASKRQSLDSKAEKVVGPLPVREPSYDELLRRIGAACERLRPYLDSKEGRVLDWMLDPAERTLTQLASAAGISKGYASKIQNRIIGKIKKDT